MLASDFFTVETLSLHRFYVLLFIELGSRRVHVPPPARRTGSRSRLLHRRHGLAAAAVRAVLRLDRDAQGRVHRLHVRSDTPLIQQARNVLMDLDDALSGPRFLIHDRDRKLLGSELVFVQQPTEPVVTAEAIEVR